MGRAKGTPNLMPETKGPQVLMKAYEKLTDQQPFITRKELKEIVRSVEQLGTFQAKSQILNKMQRSGYIETVVRLTPKGIRRAEALIREAKLKEKLLVEISDKIAEVSPQEVKKQLNLAKRRVQNASRKQVTPEPNEVYSILGGGFFSSNSARQDQGDSE